MPSLDDDFDQLFRRLQDPGQLSAAQTDPFYYFVFEPENAIEVKRLLPIWIAKLRNAGLQVERVSFVDLLWELIDAKGRWETWLAAEPNYDRGQINDSVSSVLIQNDALIKRIAALTAVPRPKTVILLTDAEVMHPYFRVRVLENALHDRVKVPTVVFYPGRRTGQFGLQYLGFYPEDGNYRATLIGGLP